MNQPVIALDGLALQPRPPEDLPTGAAADKFELRRASLGALMGLTRLGCNVSAVAPGRRAFPFHSHRANDELFLILSGSGQLRLGESRHAVQAGDLVGCPRGGPQTAHQLVNTGSQDLRYLSISTLIDPEICDYPDSGKVGAYAREPDDWAYFGASHADLDYWQGE